MYRHADSLGGVWAPAGKDRRPAGGEALRGCQRLPPRVLPKPGLDFSNVYPELAQEKSRAAAQFMTGDLGPSLLTK